MSKLNSTEEIFSEIWQKTFAAKNSILEVIVKFYDSLTAISLAMNANEIHEMVLPEVVADYVLNLNKNVEATLILKSENKGLAFGFINENKNLRDDFNFALKTLRENFTLAALEGTYLSRPGTYEPEPVEFKNFSGAKKIKVAVTGDLPPIDYIAPDGTPAGFNTAVLAEIGNFLKINIELTEIDSGARTSALASGRVDVVFWYEVDTDSETQQDIPDGVIVSEPYYEWQKFVHIRKAPPKEISKWSFKDFILDLYNSER